MNTPDSHDQRHRSAQRVNTVNSAANRGDGIVEPSDHAVCARSARWGGGQPRRHHDRGPADRAAHYAGDRTRRGGPPAGRSEPAPPIPRRVPSRGGNLHAHGALRPVIAHPGWAPLSMKPKSSALVQCRFGGSATHSGLRGSAVNPTPAGLTLPSPQLVATASPKPWVAGARKFPEPWRPP
jgi:hypothetical protein